jgi:hypothetical protein
MGNVFLAQGKFVEARRQHEEALAIRQAIGQKRIEPDSDLDLARLSIEEGAFADAERLARRAADTFRAQKAVDGEASALRRRRGGLAGAVDARRRQGRDRARRDPVARESEPPRSHPGRGSRARHFAARAGIRQPRPRPCAASRRPSRKRRHED